MVPSFVRTRSIYHRKLYQIILDTNVEMFIKFFFAIAIFLLYWNAIEFFKKKKKTPITGYNDAQHINSFQYVQIPNRYSL